MEPCTFVVNPTAGRGRGHRLLAELTDAIAAAGLGHEVAISTHPDGPAEMAADAFERGRIVIACGGDGTIGQVAGVAADAGGTLGLLPFGSGNDIARHFGFDLRKPLRNLDQLAAGEFLEIDLGRAGDRRFLSVAGAGFDAEATRWAHGVRRLSGTPLYVAAALRTLRSYRPRQFRLTIDGEEWDSLAWMVAIANTSSYGGGMKVAPDADAGDGLLHLTAVGPVGRGEFLRTFPKVFSGRHVDHPMVEVLTGRRIRLECLDADAALIADGELAGELPVEIEVLPGAVRLLVPPGRKATATPPSR